VVKGAKIAFKRRMAKRGKPEIVLTAATLTANGVILFINNAAMTTIAIHEYNEAWQQEITELILTIQQQEFDISIDIEAQPDLKNIPGFYQAGNGNFWVAVAGNAVVGTIALLDTGSDSAALRKMFVKSACRGREFGVGQMLLNKALEWATEKGFREILLGTTEKFLAAQRFYEKNGFIEIDKELLPPAFPVMQVDVKFYKYILQQ
jgi:GNAT superfamily N-acetyltransferase